MPPALSKLSRLYRHSSKRLAVYRNTSGAAHRAVDCPEALFGRKLAYERLARIEEVVKTGEASGSPYPAVQPRINALLLDAAGTLICPSEPAAAVYLRYAVPYGCKYKESQVLENFRRAYNEPWTRSALRYEGDARLFWRHIVEQSTGCDHLDMQEAIYDYFSHASAWAVAPGAISAVQRIHRAGIKLAVVSNFDTRLRSILEELQLAEHFDTMVISAEVGAEKPNPLIFELACSRLGVSPNNALVVGDDRRNDISGGRDAGCNTWMYGVDVVDFDDIQKRLLSGQIY